MLKWFRRKKVDDAEAAIAPEEATGGAGVDSESEAAGTPRAEPEERFATTDEAPHRAPIWPAEVSEDSEAAVPEPAEEEAVAAAPLGEGEMTTGATDAAPQAPEEEEARVEAELQSEANETTAAEDFAAAEAAPAPKKGLFARLRDRLSRTKTAMVDRVRAAIRLHGKVDEELLEEIEDILIQSDVGVATTQKIVGRMRSEARGAEDAEAVLGCFKRAIGEILEANNRPLEFGGAVPRVILFVGVNGTGKTTTIGKIGRELALAGRRVMMVAADTFRAGAADQLQVWAERSGAAIVRQDEGADPAAVVYEALEGVKADTPDVILIDTAGRLHTKVNLMEQLKKIRRVIQRHYPEAPHETILVLDATTGQNALSQLKTFNEATELTGLIMTKLDGTAKGGILVACKDASPLPIFKIGIGEQPEDLREFRPADFVEALFSATVGGE